MMTQNNNKEIEVKNNEIFTFEDWLSYRVFYQVQFVQMCNDSSNFTKLLGSRGMSIDTLNKIQKEQSIVYEIMVNRELELLKALFRVKYVRASIEPLEYLKMKIENVKNNLEVTNRGTYFDIISVRKERGIKYGARLISPNNYYHYNNINVGIIKFYPDSYEGLISENDYEDYSIFGNEWAFIEAEYYFLQWLKRLKTGEFGFGYSDDNLIIELSTPEPEKIEQVKIKVAKNIDNLNKIDFDILRHFSKGMQDCRNDRTKALQHTLKAMGTKIDGTPLYVKELNRVRIRLDRMGKW